MKNKSMILLLLIILLAISCGTKAEIDNSSKEDWKTNLALWNEYRNKLIFTATEMTSPTGKKEIRMVANDRDALVSIFERLELEGVPSMHKKRMDILEMIEQAPGGKSVNMSGKLANAISDFWDDVLVYAEKYEVSTEK